MARLWDRPKAETHILDIDFTDYPPGYFIGSLKRIVRNFNKNPFRADQVLHNSYPVAGIELGTGSSSLSLAVMPPQYNPRTSLQSICLILR